jgi:hypothetical protein
MKSVERQKELFDIVANVRADIIRDGTMSNTCVMPESLIFLQTIFGLSLFETQVLLICLSLELDDELRQMAKQESGYAQFATFAFLFKHTGTTDMAAAAPRSPLRRWRLIDCDSRSGILHSPIRLDERIFQYILGVNQQDERLASYIRPVAGGYWLPPGLDNRINALVQKIQLESKRSSLLPALVISDTRQGDCDAVCACIAERLQTPVFRLHSLPAGTEERETLRLLWLRETLLTKCSLICPSPENTPDLPYYASLAESSAGIVFIDSNPLPLRHRRRWIVPVGEIDSEDSHAAWHRHLGKHAASFNGELCTAVQQFHLGIVGLEHAAHDTKGAILDGVAPVDALWRSARGTVRAKISTLAKKITPKARWEHLVVPETGKETLKNIIAGVRQRFTVYNTWGFSKRDGRGLGISALLHGPSGTGKTMAAEVIARELDLELYRIDLSAVVSKYIGETEKNLRQVFDGAEEGGAILLFDEADTLFGKRSEVRDSHDRYANIEVGYLLQKIEEFHGLAILTTNLKSSFDESFLRRFRYVVEFPFPSFELRKKVWESIFPKETPLYNIDYARLARLTVPGGNIRNIAIQAAFLAADEKSPVTMDHLFRAAKVEYAKLDRTLTTAETAGWVS